jgi:N-acetyl-gamma-glutamyl-phosphate reductase
MMHPDLQLIRTGIVGGAGFTGGELIRILLRHPHAEIAWATSRQQDDTPVHAVHADLLGETDLRFSARPGPADVIFLCLPHGESPAWLDAHASAIDPATRIIDLGNDFRLGESWRGTPFVYGLSEYNRDAIRQAVHVANPGCFATAIQLGLLPLLSMGDMHEVHVVGITGSTGAGKSLQETTQFSWRHSNISPYKTFTHQHLAEIRRSASRFAGQSPDVHFVPWRGDFTRGIFVTLMAGINVSPEVVEQTFHSTYSASSFVHVSPKPIDLKQVVNTNKALIHVEHSSGQVAVHVAIDNLLKGAAGQAVQNMNLMFGLAETAGLHLKASVY